MATDQTGAASSSVQLELRQAWGRSGGCLGNELAI
jgi:hypothetical protein